ncbi:MAG: nucleotide exchange factor GrpE [Microgenomates group bacterium]
MGKKNQKVIADLENKWKRALADYDNLRKRVEKEKEEFIKYAGERILKKFLEVYDDLRVCESFLKDKGLSLICARFEEILKSEGVKRISAEGKDFDPQKMEAIEVAEGPENKVLEVVQDGWEMEGKVLRPAKVKVGGGEKAKEKIKKAKKVREEKLRGNYV